jgi:hypothetical protein
VKEGSYFSAFFRVFFLFTSLTCSVSAVSISTTAHGTATPSAHNLAHSASDTE